MELVGYEDVEARSHEALASLVVHDVEYRYYKLPFKAVKFRAGRELTEEQRRMASERAKKNLHRNN